MLASRGERASRLLLQGLALGLPGAPAAALLALQRLGDLDQACSSAADTAAAGLPPLPPPPPPPASALLRPDLQQRRWSSSSSSGGIVIGSSMIDGSSGSRWGAGPVPQRPRWLDPAAAVQHRGGLHSSAAAAAAEAEAHAEDGWQAETATQLLAGGGTMALEARAALDYLQERVGLTREQAEHALERIRNYAAPEVQCFRRSTPYPFSFENEIRPVAEWLLSNVPHMRLATCLARFPHILVGTPLSRAEANLAAIRARLPLTERQLAAALGRQPFLLRAHLEKGAWKVLSVFERIGMSPAEQAHAVASYAAVLAYSPTTIQAGVDWLRTVAGLNDAMLRKVMHRYVQLVCSSVAQLDLHLRWLLDLGVPPTAVPVVVSRSPSVLTYSRGKRDEWLAFMREEVGLGDAAIAKVLSLYPDTMGRGLPVLRRNLAFLTGELGLTQGQVHRLLNGNPGVLRCDLSSVTYAPKLAFLREVLQVAPGDVGEVLARSPLFVSYRLDRIASRGCYIAHLGRLAALTSPQAWLSQSDRDFAVRWARSSLEDFLVWREEWRGSDEGRRWLAAAAQRSTRMSEIRAALDRGLDAAAAVPQAEEVRQRLAAQRHRLDRLQSAEALAAEGREDAAAAVLAEMPGRGRSQRRQGQALPGAQLLEDVRWMRQRAEQQVQRLQRLAAALEAEQQQQQGQ